MTVLDRAREALHTIPADLPRDEWVRAGMAAHAAGLDFDEFDTWSANAPSYDPRAARDTWRSFRPDGGIGPGTLFAMAELYGWKQGNGRAQVSPRSKEVPKPHPQGGGPSRVFDRFTPATADHAYIVAKQGIPDGLRVVPSGDPLRIAGQSMVGCLAVPCHRADGTVSTLQFVPAPGQGKKLNLPGNAFDGWFTVGQLTSGGTAYLCEGIGQGWACWKATGQAAVVCFGWGRVRTVAAQLRERHPEATLVVVPDVGKEDDAEKLATDMHLQWVRLPAGWPQNADVNDLAQRDGFDALEALLAAPIRPLRNEPRPPFALVPIADLDHFDPPPPVYAWEGLIPSGHVTLVAAHGGVGKTTLMLMLSVSVAAERPLFGIPTSPGGVVFFSGEDGAGRMRYQLRYICRQLGVSATALAERLFILDATDDPTLFAEVMTAGRREGITTATYDALREFLAGKDVRLLVIDNASDVFDASEIERAKVRGLMRALARIAREFDLAVVLLAHVDKGTSRGERAGTEAYTGSTAWHNSARSRLAVLRDKDGALLIEHQKHNLGPLHAPIRLTWPHGGIPQADEPLGAVVQGIADRNHEKALLKLIAEFTARGEHVSAATVAKTNAPSLLSNESSYPKLKAAEVFDLLRRSERAGRLARITVRTEHRKTKEVWQLTDAGAAFAGVPAPSAPSAPTTDVGAVGAVAAEGAPSAPSSALGGMGDVERAHPGSGEVPQ